MRGSELVGLRGPQGGGGVGGQRVMRGQSSIIPCNCWNHLLKQKKL